MLIREYLKTLTCRRKSNSRRRLSRPHGLSERLESRAMLTGNVQVSLSGANAQLIGDTANNEIDIVVDNGSMAIYMHSWRMIFSIKAILQPCNII